MSTTLHFLAKKQNLCIYFDGAVTKATANSTRFPPFRSKKPTWRRAHANNNKHMKTSGKSYGRESYDFSPLFAEFRHSSTAKA
jgi:hypothetical protein